MFTGLAGGPYETKTFFTPDHPTKFKALMSTALDAAETQKFWLWEEAVVILRADFFLRVWFFLVAVYVKTIKLVVFVF